MTSEQLITEYASTGNGELFAEIVRRHGDQLFRIALLILRNVADAEDAMQTVWMRIHLKAGQYAGQSRATSWMIAIVRCTALNILQRGSQKRRGNVLAIEDEGVISDGSKGQLAEHDEAETIDCVRRAVNRLPRRIRDVVEIVDMQECRYRVAARKLHIPVGTVRSRRHRGIKLLRKSLQRELAA